MQTGGPAVTTCQGVCEGQSGSSLARAYILDVAGIIFIKHPGRNGRLFGSCDDAPYSYARFSGFFSKRANLLANYYYNCRCHFSGKGKIDFVFIQTNAISCKSAPLGNNCHYLHRCISCSSVGKYGIVFFAGGDSFFTNAHLGLAKPDYLCPYRGTYTGLAPAAAKSKVSKTRLSPACVFRARVEKAAEGRRSPRRCARHGGFYKTRSVLECASPLALHEQQPFRLNRPMPSTLP